MPYPYENSSNEVQRAKQAAAKAAKNVAVVANVIVERRCFLSYLQPLVDVKVLTPNPLPLSP